MAKSKYSISGDWEFKSKDKHWKKEIKNLEEQIEYALNQGDTERAFELYDTLQEKIKDIVAEYTAAGYSGDSTPVLEWLNRGYDYAEKEGKIYDELTKELLRKQSEEEKADQAEKKDLIDSLRELTRATDAAAGIQEKTLAAEQAGRRVENARQDVKEAEEGLANARAQRTVRVWDEQSRSWQWIADEGAVKAAEDAVERSRQELESAVLAKLKADDALDKAKINDQLAVLESLIESLAADDTSRIPVGAELYELIKQDPSVLPEGWFERLLPTGTVTAAAAYGGYAGNGADGLSGSMAAELLRNSGLSGNPVAELLRNSGVGGGSAAELLRNSGLDGNPIAELLRNSGLGGSMAEELLRNSGQVYNYYFEGGIRLGRNEAESMTLADLANRLVKLGVSEC